jgi:hypothetical protein
VQLVITVIVMKFGVVNYGKFEIDLFWLLFVNLICFLYVMDEILLYSKNLSSKLNPVY